ncbi:MAG TPA: SpoIID/LytB domain-containing protein, partial [Elusimicrobiales bacterium]|nr:SpoIID/LytB domain-containing protein [Elusimicrobiales bacterium]
MTRLLLTLLLSIPNARSAAGADEQVIRVAIARNVKQFRLNTSADAFLVETKTGQRYQLLARSVYEVKYISPSSLAVAGQTLESPVRILAGNGGDAIRMNGRHYKGDIYLRTNGAEKLEVVEHLPVEDYLCGVLPAEMSPDWPLEALKAQAVASR